ncbi:hypothetical protein B0H11DRAFT_2219840 [Mycena galericulata]|nr:hypothetical protein B0H11DRAFT_2219840 [Mycena galericulata]
MFVDESQTDAPLYILDDQPPTSLILPSRKNTLSHDSHPRYGHPVQICPSHYQHRSLPSQGSLNDGLVPPLAPAMMTVRKHVVIEDDDDDDDDDDRPGVAARHGNGDISRANDEDDAEEIDADPDADADEDDDIAMHGNAKGHTAPQVSDDDEEEPHAGRVRRASAKQAQRLAEQEAANARKVANAAKVAKKQRIQERGEDPVPQEDTVFTSREVEVPTKKKSLPQRDNRVPRLPAEPTKVRLGMEWPASHCKTFAISLCALRRLHLAGLIADVKIIRTRTHQEKINST